MSRRIKRQEDGETKGERDADFTCLELPEIEATFCQPIDTVVTDAERSTKMAAHSCPFAILLLRTAATLLFLAR